MAKVNAINIANTLIQSNFNFEVIKSETSIEDYSKEDLMKLLITKIGHSCHQSDQLVSKATTIVNTKIDTSTKS